MRYKHIHARDGEYIVVHRHRRNNNNYNNNNNNNGGDNDIGCLAIAGIVFAIILIASYWKIILFIAALAGIGYVVSFFLK